MAISHPRSLGPLPTNCTGVVINTSLVTIFNTRGFYSFHRIGFLLFLPLFIYQSHQPRWKMSFCFMFFLPTYYKYIILIQQQILTTQQVTHDLWKGIGWLEKFGYLRCTNFLLFFNRFFSTVWTRDQKNRKLQHKPRE